MKHHISVTACVHCRDRLGDDLTRSDRRFCSNKCRQADYRRRVNATTNPVEALVRGNNADLIKQVARLYATEKDTIADVTYGKGAFWKKTPHLNVTGSDLLTVPERPYDFRNLPYGDRSYDIVVYDPPYLIAPGNFMADGQYNNASTTKGFLHGDIRTLYAEGIREAARVAKRQVWVKCKDQVSAGIQRWFHIHILQDAEAMGLVGRDLFILDATARVPNSRWDTQNHARKPMSYLWVLDIPKDYHVAVSGG